MSKFTDKLNREWTIDITVAAMRRAKHNDIDLSMPVAQMKEYLMDDVFSADAIWAIVEPEAKAKGITLDQFDAGLDGKVLNAARESLWSAYYEYFDEGKAALLRSTVSAAAEAMLEASKSLTSSGLVGFRVNSDMTSAHTE